MVKSQLKLVVKREKKLVAIYNSLTKALRYSDEKDILSRRKLSLFDYIELAEPLRYYPYTFNKENNLYGNGKAIFSSLGIERSQEKYYKIEHGLILGSFVPKDSYDGFTKHIITFSDYRKQYLSHTNKNIICVGPYIQYADYLLSQEKLLNLKKQLGRVLLVFPSHSIDNIHVSYDISKFINHIEDIRHDFDTVVICMYWKDILLAQHIEYQNKGYKITTAGHFYDYNFLPRLKSIIALSDLTLSNKVGTHVGYCINLNKPHLIKLSDIRLKFFDKSEEKARQNNEWRSYYDACEDIHKYFCVDSQLISIEQLQCVKKYWGEWTE